VKNARWDSGGTLCSDVCFSTPNVPFSFSGDDFLLAPKIPKD
jgi:hypothetical protein